jgi:hypothetical protein
MAFWVMTKDTEVHTINYNGQIGGVHPGSTSASIAGVTVRAANRLDNPATGGLNYLF